MKIYQAHYETHDGLGPRSALDYECEHSETQGSLEIFIKDYGYRGAKAYALETETDDITEVYAAHPLYTLNSVLLVAYAALLVLTGFETTLADLFGVVFATVIPVSAMLIAATPDLMISLQPGGFRRANYPENGVPDLQPVAFLNHARFSKLVYLNYIATGIILHSQIFSGFHVLSPVYFLGIGGAILLHKNAHDPATDKTVLLSIFAVLPYVITVLNLLIYSQWQKLMGDINNFWMESVLLVSKVVNELLQASLIWVSPSQRETVADIGSLWMTSVQLGSESLAGVVRTPLVGLIAVNLVAIYVLTRLKQNLESPGDPFGMYTTPAMIVDKKYLRVGISLMLGVYIATSFVVVSSQLVGYPLIPIETVISGLLIFWPLCVSIPAAIMIWYYRRSHRTVPSDIDPNNHHRTIDDIPVILKDTAEREGTAFVLPNAGNPVIVVDEQFRHKLSEDEMRAVCYHELYHIKYNSIKYQRRIETPIIGYVLFFLSVNISEIHNDEYRADVFAAKHVGAETVRDALKKADSITEHSNKSIIKANIDQPSPSNDSKRPEIPARIKRWVNYFGLFCSPPVLSIYSPSAEDRITRVENME